MLSASRPTPILPGDPALPIVSRFRRLGHLGDLDKCLGSLEDLEDATTAHQRVVALTSDGLPVEPFRLSNLSNVLVSRFDRRGDLYEAFAAKHRALDLIRNDRPSKLGYLNNFGIRHHPLAAF
ncbi:hypothetical protein K488DRAFT_89516 [Vararia minispora EC-137]|uniref:Uncharacterized protein n=1 Tax=Vararia minispora EC-137 TaxID=1314806 RepID=A0ACB8QA22_9AGAM|nr:hypothetical protein K488DRAFT_89516 [Vararia minispora EC-137]